MKKTTLNLTTSYVDLLNDEKVKEVEGAHLWIVSWNSRTGDYSTDIKRVAKAFLLEEDANQLPDETTVVLSTYFKTTKIKKFKF